MTFWIFTIKEANLREVVTTWHARVCNISIWKMCSWSSPSCPALIGSICNWSNLLLSPYQDKVTLMFTSKHTVVCMHMQPFAPHPHTCTRGWYLKWWLALQIGGCLRPENTHKRLKEKTHDITFDLLPSFRLSYFLADITNHILEKYILYLIILFSIWLCYKKTVSGKAHGCFMLQNSREFNFANNKEQIVLLNAVGV